MDLWQCNTFQKLVKDYQASIDEALTCLRKYLVVPDNQEGLYEGVVRLNTATTKARDATLAAFVAEAIMKGARDVFVMAAELDDACSFFKLLATCLTQVHQLSPKTDFEVFELNPRQAGTEADILATAYIENTGSDRNTVKLTICHNGLAITRQTVQLVLPWELDHLMSPDILIVLSVSPLMAPSSFAGHFLSVVCSLPTRPGEYQLLKLEAELRQRLNALSLRLPPETGNLVPIEVTSRSRKRVLEDLNVSHVPSLAAVSIPMPTFAPVYFAKLQALIESDYAEPLLALLNCSVFDAASASNFVEAAIRPFEESFAFVFLASGGSPVILSALILGFSKKVCRIVRLTTHPFLRRRGFATQLLQRSLRALQGEFPVSSSVALPPFAELSDFTDPPATSLAVVRIPLRLEEFKLFRVHGFYPVGISAFPEPDTGLYELTLERAVEPPQKALRFLERFTVTCLGTHYRALPSRLVASIINCRYDFPAVINVTENNIDVVLNHYDIARIERYAATKLDPSIVKDLWSQMALLYARDLCKALEETATEAHVDELRLTPIQVIVLVGVGLQGKSAQDLSIELEIPVDQVNVQCGIIVKRFHRYLVAVLSRRTDKTEDAVKAETIKARELGQKNRSLADDILHEAYRNRSDRKTH